MRLIQKYKLPLMFLLSFESVAVGLWLGNVFYLFNFTYIGGSLALS